MYQYTPESIYGLCLPISPEGAEAQAAAGKCLTESYRAMRLRDRIQHEINCASAENGSNTPDFVLGQYLMDCLAAFDRAVNARESHYGRPYSAPMIAGINCGYDANGSPAEDELSKDVIEAARDAQGG